MILTKFSNSIFTDQKSLRSALKFKTKNNKNQINNKKMYKNKSWKTLKWNFKY